ERRGSQGTARRLGGLDQLPVLGRPGRGIRLDPLLAHVADDTTEPAGRVVPPDDDHGPPVADRGAPLIAGRRGPPLAGRGGPPVAGRGGPPVAGRGGPPVAGRGGPPMAGRGGPPVAGRGGPPVAGRGGPPDDCAPRAAVLGHVRGGT